MEARSDGQTNTQVLVKFENGEIVLDVSVGVDNDTVWLTQDDMALLFGKNKSTISRYIRNVFEEGELEEISSIAKNATQLKNTIQEQEKIELVLCQEKVEVKRRPCIVK